MKLIKNPVLFAALAVSLAIHWSAWAGNGHDQAAAGIAQQNIIVDTHIDTPYRLSQRWEDVTSATEQGEFDYERARRGGLDVPFMSIFTPASAEAEGSSFKIANSLIDNVEALVGRAPGKFALVYSPDDAVRVFRSGKVGLAMGMENGSPIEGKLENVAFFRDRGISYITLAHSLSNHLSDSSYDVQRNWNGLSPFGKQVVAEMNRLGVMVDVSHLSKTPAIASHSSARHFTPGWERNMSDEMIQALANKGGVIMINFGSSFLTDEARQWYTDMGEARSTWMAEHGFDDHSPERSNFSSDYRKQNPFPYADMDDVMMHFEHVIDLVGIDHVGIGSDFDGVGDSLPEGMKDVSFYPNLIKAFLEAEYSPTDIAKVMNGNLMRVWQANLDYAARAAMDG